MLTGEKGSVMTARAIEKLIRLTEREMRDVVEEAESSASGVFASGDLSLYGMIRYHLGWVDEQFSDVRADAGKRVRPVVCLLSAGAAGGDPGHAIPVAAGIELLHNFTLMHDDVQDRSTMRRGRPTVWHLWGEAQAINAGDATFALSQLAVLRGRSAGLDGETLADIVDAFNRMTLQIVEGQVLDLGFEQRSHVSPDDYLRMISGKTAAIVAFATWAGARVAGCTAETCERYREFGRLLGLGFQVRDDYLGIWGDNSMTGKQAGDDIRGRKQSIPIIMLLESLTESQRQELQRIYAREALTDQDVKRVTSMLDEHNVARLVDDLTERYHDQALELLYQIAGSSADRDALVGLCEQLVERSR